MFGSKKTTVVNTTTVDNNIYLDNQVENDVQVTAEFNPTFANAVSVDTAPIADAVKEAVAPIDRMAQSILATMEDNTKLSATNAALQLLGMNKQAEGLAALGEGLADKPEGTLGEVAGKLESVTKIAAAVLTLAAVYFLFAKGRLPDIEVSA